MYDNLTRNVCLYGKDGWFLETKRLARRSIFIWACFFFMVLWMTWLIFRVSGWPIDYETFYRAGKEVLANRSPYQVIGGVGYGPYLNGPLFALIMATFALAPHAVSIQLFQAANLLALSLAAWLTKSVIDRVRPAYCGSWFSVGILFLAMTSVRETLLLAQVDLFSMLGVALFLKGYTLCTPFSRRGSIMMLIGLTLLFQVKLYLCLPLLLLLLVDRRIVDLIVFAATQMVLFFVCSWMAKTNLFVEWVSRLLHRQAATASDNGQASLWSLWKRLPLPHGLSFFFAIVCSLVILLFFLHALVRSRGENFEGSGKRVWRVGLALAAGLLLSSFAHETDFSVLAIPLALLVTEERVLRRSRTMLAGLAVSAGGFAFINPLLFFIIQVISLTLFWFVTRRTREGVTDYLRFIIITLLIGSLSVSILYPFGVRWTMWFDEGLMIVYALIIYTQSYRRLLLASFSQSSNKGF